MKKIKETYTLIKSLSSGEKRFFNIYSNKYTKANSSSVNKLFHFLNEMKEFDEKLIQKSNFNKHLSANNHNLLNEVLTSLRLQNEESDINLKINKITEDVRILFKKNLFNLCLIKLKKVEKIALEYEKLDRLLEIYHLKSIVSIRILDNEKFNEFNDQISKKRFELIEVIKNKEQFALLSQQLFFLYRKYGSLPSKERNEIVKFIKNNPLLSNADNAKCISSIISFYFIHTINHLTNEDTLKALASVKCQLDVFEKNRAYLSTNIDQYIAVLNNAIFLYSELKEVVTFLFYINKLRELPVTYNLKEVGYKRRIFETSYTIELDLYLKTSNYQKLNLISCEALSGLKKYKMNGLSKDKLISISLSLALNHYYQSEFELALDLINSILEVDPKINLQHAFYTKVFNLLIHFELKNYKLLFNKIKSLKKFMKDKSLSNVICDDLLKLLFKIPLSHEPSKLYSNFIEKYENVTINSDNEFFITYLKLAFWSKSKLNNISFKEQLIQSKSNS